MPNFFKNIMKNIIEGKKLLALVLLVVFLIVVTLVAAGGIIFYYFLKYGKEVQTTELQEKNSDMNKVFIVPEINKELVLRRLKKGRNFYSERKIKKLMVFIKCMMP